MIKKGIFIAENMASTNLGSLLRSAVQDTAIENGNIVALGDLVNGELDLYEAGVVTDNKDVIYFVDGVELLADEQLTKGLDDFENVAEKPFRVRKPAVGDRFSISENMITPASGTEVTLGNVVETPASGNKLVEKSLATDIASFGAKILERWTFGTRAVPMVRLEVFKVL